VLNEKCYKDRNITSPEYFEIYGQLKNYLNIPSYQVFNVTELVPIMFTTYSDCKGVSERPEENPVANASSYTIEVYHPDEGWLSCSSENLYNGSYNCTFDSTGHREGNWSIRFNSSKDYFNDNTTIYPDQFWLENLNTTSGNGTIWILENGAWTQTWSGGWSRLYNYTLDVYDVEGDTVNCSLYLSKDNGTSWFYVGSDVINGIAGTPTKGTCSVMYHGFTCSDIDSHEGENWDESKAKWFKWMVEDNEPTDTYNTIPVQGPNITESNVRIDYITGNGTTLYRNHDTSRLGVNVFDNENQSYPSGVNVSYWVTNDSIHYRLEMINETNGLGNASYYFSPNCSHLVGPQYWPQYWKAGVEDKCYIDKNVSNNFTYWLIGWLNGTIEGIRNQTLDRRTIFLNGTNVTINATVLDECSVGVESSYVNITLIHESSKEYRCSPVNDLGGGEYSCIFNTSENPDPMLARWYNISVLTNKTPWYVYNYSLRYIPETGSGPGAFFIETKPILSNPMVNTSAEDGDTGSTGGYSETFNFSVRVTDRDSDMVRAYLYIRRNGGGWEKLIGTNSSGGVGGVNYVSCTNCNNTVLWISKNNFDCPDIDKYEFKWNATDTDATPAGYSDESHIYTDETEPKNFTIEPDDVEVLHYYGNNRWIWRNGTQSIVLSTYVYDIDAGVNLTVGEARGKIWITNDSQTFREVATMDLSGTPGETGFFNYTFQPDCVYGYGPDHYDVGVQKWIVGTVENPSGTCYKLVNSTVFNVTLKSYLNETISLPNGKSYEKYEDNVPLNFFVFDECNNGLENITPTITLIHPTKTYTIYSSDITDLHNGTYNTTWDPDTNSANLGAYNVSIYSKFDNWYKDYYVPVTKLKPYAFRIQTRPKLYGESVDCSGDCSWGELWAFDVYCSDEDYDNLNVTLWKKKDSSSPWVAVDTKPCQSTSGELLSFSSHYFNCSDITPPGENSKWKFNTTDPWGFNETTSIHTDNILKDDVSIIPYSVSKTHVNREGNDNVTFGMLIKDTDRNQYVGENVSTAFYVTENSEWDTGHFNNTTSSSISYFTFFPDCNYNASWHWWKGGTYNDECYKDANFTPQNYESLSKFEILGQLKLNITHPNEGQYFIVWDVINYTLNVTDECNSNWGPIENASVGLWLQSPSGEWEHHTPNEINEIGNGYYSYLWNTSFHQGGWWNVKFEVNKTHYNPNTTTWISYTYLNNTPPEVYNFSVTPNKEGWGRTFTYEAFVNDTQLDNVTCKLYTSTNNKDTWVYQGEKTIYYGVGKCEINVSDFTCSDKGTDNYYKFEIYDGTNRFNTSDQYGPNITEDDASIEYVLGNDTTVDRFGDNTTLLIVRTKDLDRNNISVSDVNVTFWITNDGSNYLAQPIHQTNSSGYLNYYFNPNCDPLYDVGKQYWKAGVTDGCYVDINTSSNYTLTINGSLSNSIVEINYLAPPINVTKTEENVTVEGKVLDDCSVEQPGAKVNISLIHESGISYPCKPVKDLGSGYYRCEANTSDMKAKWYNVSMNSSKEYLGKTIHEEGDVFFLQTRPILTNYIPLNSPGGWGETFYYNVTVTDEDEDNVTLDLYVEKPGTAVWIFEDEVNLTSPVINKTVTLSAPAGTFECPQHLGNGEFKFEASDSRLLTRNVINNFTVERDDVRFEEGSGDGEFVWRNGTDSLLLSLLVIDNDRNLSTPGGLNSKFWVTLDGNSWDNGKNAQTNDSGYINYDFMNELPIGQQKCDYSLGVQNWRAWVNGTCYKPTYSKNYTLTIKSNLILNITIPDGEGYLRGDLVPIKGRVEDDCSKYPSGVEDATVTYELFIGGNKYTCSKTNNAGWSEGNGWYNCTWDSSARAKGYYDIRMNGSKIYYGPNSTRKDDAFFLGEAPTLSNPGVDHNVGGWGEEYVFSVIYSDPDYQDDNVSVWGSYDNVTWSLIDSKLVKGVDRTVNFYDRFTCENMSTTPLTGIRYFKFRVVDPFGYSDETTPQNISLVEDNVTVSVTSNTTSIVRRIGNQDALLQFRIYDSDLGVYPNQTSGRIWVTRDHNNYDVIYSCNSNNGYCGINHDPNCTTSVGVQKWIGGVVDSCYQSLNTSKTDLTVIGQLNTSVLNPVNGIIVNRDENVTLNATVSNDCNESINDSLVSWYNESWDLLAQGYNTTWTVPSSYGLGPRTVYVNATRQYYDLGANQSDIYVYGWSEVDNIVPSNGSDYIAGLSVNVRCHVSDVDTSNPIENYTVKFYKNGALVKTEIADSDGWATWSWSTATESPGWYNISCNISDDSELYYNTTVSERSTLILIRRPLLIDYINVNPSSIYRNDSYNPNEANISVRVQDALTGPAEGANVTFYNLTSYLDSCLSDSDGRCWVMYNAPDNTTPDIYTIYINATKSGTEPSEIFTVASIVVFVPFGAE